MARGRRGRWRGTCAQGTVSALLQLAPHTACAAPPRFVELQRGDAVDVISVENVWVEAVLQETRHHGAGNRDVEPASSGIIPATDLRGSSCDIGRRREGPYSNGRRRSGADGGSTSYCKGEEQEVR
jgi:hypothetical protein